jgi:hypothetical protein
MAQQEKIGGLIDEKAFAELARLKKEFIENQDELIKYLGLADKLNQTLGASKGASQIATNAQKVNDVIKKVSETQEKQRLGEIKLQQEREKSFDDYEKKLKKQQGEREKTSALLEKERLAEIKLQQAREKNIDDFDKQTAKAAEAARAYNVLNKALKDAENSALDLGAKHGADSPLFIKAAEGALALRKQVDSLETPLLKFQRNVGNYQNKFQQYASNLRDLGNPLRAVAEVIGFSAEQADEYRIILEHAFHAVSAFTGGKKDEKGQTSAIDDVKEAQEGLASAQETVATTQEQLTAVKEAATSIIAGETVAVEGQTIATAENAAATEGAAVAQTELAVATTASSTAMKVFRYALLATGIGVVIGLVALLIYKYREQKEALDALNKAEEQRIAIVKEVADANSQGAQNAQEELVSLKVLYQASQDRTLSLKERKKAVDEIQKQYPEYFKNIKDEVILTGGAKTAYDDLTTSILATAKARASEELLTANSKRQVLNQTAITEERAKNLKLRQQEAAAIKALREADAKDTGGSITGSSAEALSAYSQMMAIKNKIAESDEIIYNRTSDTNLLTQKNLVLEKNIADLVKKNGVKTIFPKPDQKDKTKDTTVKDQTEAYNLAIQNEKRANDFIQENDKSTYAQKIKSIEDFEKNSKDFIDQRAKYEVNQEGLTALQIKNIRKTASLDKDGIALEALKERQKLGKDVLKGLAAAIEKYDGAIEGAENDSINIIKEAGQKRNEQIAAESQARIVELQKGYDSQKITLEQFNSEKEKTEHEASQETLANEIAAQQKIVETRKMFLEMGYGNEKDLLADQKKLYDLNVKYFQDASNEKQKLSQEEIDKRLKLIAKIQKAETAVEDFIVAAVNARFENQLNGLKKQEDAVDSSTAKEIDAVNRSLASDQQKADKIAVINAQAAVKKQALTDQENKLKTKQAKFEKEVNIADAIMKGAALTIEGFLKGGPPLGLLYAGIAAFEIATIVATPIPQYFTGTPSSKAGLAIVGEQGTEKVIEPSGHTWYTPPVPTLVNLVGGSEIVNNKELMQSIARPPKFEGKAPKDSNRDVVNAIEKGNRELKEAVLSLKPTGRRGITFDNSQLERWEKFRKGYLK